MPERGEDNFLLRWSRRKRAARRDDRAPEPDREVGPGGEARGSVTERPVDAMDGSVDTGEAVAGPVASDEFGAGGETVPEDLVGVDVETLDYHADFTRFMKEDVPEALRKRALRQLWRSDPILANVDGLNDYDDDFTDAALAVKVLQTAHKIGRGYLDDDADRDKDVGIDGDDAEDSAEIRAEAEDAAVEPGASESEEFSKAETGDSSDDISAGGDGSDPSGEGEVTRSS